MNQLAVLASTATGTHHAAILPIVLLVIAVAVAIYFIARARKRRGR